MTISDTTWETIWKDYHANCSIIEKIERDYADKFVITYVYETKPPTIIVKINKVNITKRKENYALASGLNAIMPIVCNLTEQDITDIGDLFTSMFMSMTKVKCKKGYVQSDCIMYYIKPDYSKYPQEK